ncbi:allergen Fel d 4-like [Sphaerodactylus townsendi]|uniref:Uncharacterized protein n=1 Tax=Sphaerodactylus townsendi TaxID=933632 RepID=A0ACB8EZH5_9SAUR|nr:allergen Fel d 4-like [Sphaerodactylus townsendi]
MKLWLVGLGLALLCTVNAESECSLDHTQLDGTWFMNLFATDCEHMLKHKGSVKMLVSHISSTNDKVKISTKFPGKKNGCKKIELELQKLDDGTFYHSSEWGTTKKMEVMATDCETYVLIRATMEHRGKISNHLGLYTKEPEVTPELKEKFLESANNSGFTDEQIFTPHEVACPDEE